MARWQLKRFTRRQPKLAHALTPRTAAPQQSSVVAALRHPQTTLAAFAREHALLLNEVYQRVTERQPARFVRHTTHPHVWRMRAPSPRHINNALPIMATSFGLATAGALVYPPLGLLSLPGAIYATLPIYQNAVFSLLYDRRVHVHTLFTITAATCIVGGYYFYFNLAALLYILSRKLLLYIRDESQRSLVSTFSQQPRFAWMEIDGVEVQVPIAELQRHDHVIVHAGEGIPVDGVVVAGIASVDQRALTGEAQPTDKELGDTVYAATTVLSGRIVVAVEQAGNATIAAQIKQILEQTAGHKGDMQLRAEALADRTVVPMLAVSALALPLLGPISAAAVLNAHFGYRVAVIAPIAILIYFRLMSQRGILVKDGQVLDSLSAVDTVVFDKTGTLTEEIPTLGTIHTFAAWSAADVLAMAATAEAHQTHPIAQAITRAAAAQHLAVPTPDDAAYEVGYGLTVTLDQQQIHVGSSRFMELRGIAMPEAATAALHAAHEHGHSLVMVARDNHLIGALELQPTIRPEAYTIVARLRERGIKHFAIISGDHATPTRMLAAQVGIEQYFAETLPQDKAAIIRHLQARGHTVCYIGDGINDAIALKQAHISVSLRGAATIATDTAQIVLMNGNLTLLSTMFDLAHQYDTTMNVCFGMILLPTLVGVSGVFLLGFGLPHTILLKQFGLVGGVAGALSPLAVRHLRAIQKAEPHILVQRRHGR